MNTTQELITNDFTIGHAEQTIRSLYDETERQLRNEANKLNGGEQYVKLKRVQAVLFDLKQKAKEAKTLIDRIDYENESNSGYTLVNSKSEVVVTDLQGVIVCRLIKDDYAKGEALNKVCELVLMLNKANKIV